MNKKKFQFRNKYTKPFFNQKFHIALMINEKKIVEFFIISGIKSVLGVKLKGL